MTSEEIKNLKRGFGDVLDWTEDQEQFAHRAIDGIWEIAYQLAVFNEHNPDALPDKPEHKHGNYPIGCPACQWEQIEAANGPGSAAHLELYRRRQFLRTGNR